MRAKCDSCGKTNAVIRERTDPRNFRPIRRLLCGPCGTRLGYALPYPHNERGSVLKVSRPG
jgi:hypothetical protein